MVLHFTSLDRIRELFTIAGLCGITFFKVNGNFFGCCRKVNTFMNGMNMIGYVIAKKCDKWMVHLVSDEVIEVGNIHYNRSRHRYEYPQQ